MAHSSGYFAIFCTSSISRNVSWHGAHFFSPTTRISSSNPVCFDLQDVNEILNKAEAGARDMYNPGWYYKYVPTLAALSAAISPDNRTKTPVEESPSEFIGKSLEELAATLISAPDKVDLNRRFFAVLDKRSEDDGSLVLCHVVENGGVDWLRCWPKNSSLNLRGMSMMSPTWEELKTAWERKKKTGADVVD